MKKIYLFLYLFIFLNVANSQIGVIKSWDYRYGGNDFDYPATFLKTMDGGYLLCGNSLSSVSFDKTETCRGGLDYYIIKADNLGRKQWDKTYGGSETDNLTCAILLPDSGYLIGGYSSSGISGDKTEDNASPLIPTDDYWVIRVDKNGNKIWDKTFGGDKKDRLNSLLVLSDGSYLLGGYSISDHTGNMSNYSYGDNDFWIIKIDTLGNKIWDINYGGIYDDRLITLSLTPDNCIIMAGYSNSIAGTGKSQSTCNNSYDYWIVKINQAGIKLWDKSYGGTSKDNYTCMTFLPSGKMVFAGVSFPGVGCEKTQANVGNLGYTDYWVLCTDSSGNKLWDNVYGGDRNEDELNNISLTDEGILITGTSYSFKTGNKSENNVLSAEQPWLLTIDTLGNILWDKTLHNPTHAEYCFGFQESDGCYVFLSHALAAGGYVTQTRNSMDDFWISKFCLLQNHPVANCTSTSRTLCQNSCIDFTNQSMNATSYQWLFPGGTPPSAAVTNPPDICYFNQGTYDVTLIASNPTESDTLTLKNFVTVLPQVQFSPITQIGDTLFSVPGYAHYEWYYESSLIPGGNDYYLIADRSGNYSILVTDSNGCQAIATMLQVIASTKELKEKKEGIGAIYFSGAVYLNSGSSISKPAMIELNDALGKIIYSKKIFVKNGLNILPLPIDNISAGIYFIKITSSGQMLTLKIFLN